MRAAVAARERDAGRIRADKLSGFRVELAQLDAGPEGAKGEIGAPVRRIDAERIDGVEIVAVLRHQDEALILPAFAGLERIEGRIGHEADGARVTPEARQAIIEENRLARRLIEGAQTLDGLKPSAARAQAGGPWPITPASVHLTPSGEVLARMAPCVGPCCPVPSATNWPSISITEGSWICTSPVICGCGSAASRGAAQRSASASPNALPVPFRQTDRMADSSCVLMNIGPTAFNPSDFGGRVRETRPDIRPGRPIIVNAREDSRPMNLHDIAKEVLEVLGTGRQLDPFSKVYPDFGLKDAYNVTATVRAGREARGERSDRPQDRVHQPDHLGGIRRLCADLGLRLRPHGPGPYPRGTRGFAERPGRASHRAGDRVWLAAPPEPGMDEQALIRCIDWIAHGFEIVQSIFPNWSFQAPDTVAAYGLHGRLFVGPRHSAASRRDAWARELSRFEIDLFRNGALVDHGAAANVLDGPLLALRHLAETLAQDPHSPALAAGEIVTTGTLTRAFPVAAGEEWNTRLTGIPFEPARIRFV